MPASRRRGSGSDAASARALPERDEHVDHAVLQHLKAPDRRAELLAGLGVFQRCELSSLIAPTASAQSAAMARSRHASSAATPSPSSPGARHLAYVRRLGGAPAIDGLETLQMEIGGWRSTTNRLMPSRSALPGGARRDDQLVRPGRPDDGGLCAGQMIVLALAPRRRGDVGRNRSASPSAQASAQIFARDDVREKRCAVLRSRCARAGRPREPRSRQTARRPGGGRTPA